MFPRSECHFLTRWKASRCLHDNMELGVKEVVGFDQLVRIFVDTDLDTHFIVSLSRTSSVSELRELVKATHRHCYPNSGDVDIGKLAVPSGDYGYHLADFLRIGQIYNRYEGKVFAEVENHNPASSIVRGLVRLPVPNFQTRLSPKKVPLLAPQIFENSAIQRPTISSGFVPVPDSPISVGEPGTLLAVGFNMCKSRNGFEGTKLQREELKGDKTCSSDSGEPLDRLPSRVRGLGLDLFEGVVEEDEKLADVPIAAVCDRGEEFSGGDFVMKLVHLNPVMYSADFQRTPDKTSEGATPGFSSDSKGVSKKRDASESIEKLSKSRRLTLPAISSRTSMLPIENGQNEIRNGLINWSKNDWLNLDGMHYVVKETKELAAASLSQLHRSRDLDAKTSSVSRGMKKKKKSLHNLDLTVSKDQSEIAKDMNLGPEDQKDMGNVRKDSSVFPNLHLNLLMTIGSSISSRTDEKSNQERQENIDPANGSGVDGDNEALESPSVLNFLNDEISENETPRREAEVSKDTSGEGKLQMGAVAMGLANIDDMMLSPTVNVFGDNNGVETSTSNQGGTKTSLQALVAKVGSVESQGTPSLSKHFSSTRAGRGAPSETRNSESSGNVTKGKNMGGWDTKTSESQSSQGSENAKQHLEGINIVSELSAAWLLRSKVRRATGYSEADSRQVIASPKKVAHASSERVEREPGFIDQLDVTNPVNVAHSKSTTGESSAESDPKFVGQSEVRSQLGKRRNEDQILEALHMGPTLRSAKNSQKHANIPARSEVGEVNLKNDSHEFFSQDQSFHVTPTQVDMALTGRTTEDSDDAVEGKGKFEKPKTDYLDIGFKIERKSEKSNGESRGIATSGCGGSSPLATKTPAPSDSRMRGYGGSQSFKRRASGLAAEIETKYAQFIESQGGLDEIMGITLGQLNCSMPIESSSQARLRAHSIGSIATTPGSPINLALKTQESVRNSSMGVHGSVVGLKISEALDLAPASQNAAGNLSTPQFKVPKPVPIGTITGAGQSVFNSASTVVQSPGREVAKLTALKDFLLKRKKAVKHVKKKERNVVRLEKMLSVVRGAFLDDLNAAEQREIRVAKTSEGRKRPEEKYQGAQFLVVNNTDFQSQYEREDKKLGSEDEIKIPSSVRSQLKSSEIRPEKGFINSKDSSLFSPKQIGKKRGERKVKKESVVTGVVGCSEMSELDISGKQMKRNKTEKGVKRSKKKKFLAEELDEEEVIVLPETSIERSARETEELYFKLEKANRDLWLQNSVSSLKNEEKRIENQDFSPAEVNAIEVVKGENPVQSRLEGGESEVNGTNDKERLVSDIQVFGGDTADKHLCAGIIEASRREDKKTLHQGKFQLVLADVFDYVSGDETTTNILSKSAKQSGMNEKKKAKRMEELSSRAVERVLDDEMLHVVDTNYILGKKSRKDPKPLKWTVRMRGFTPSALATSFDGGIIPYSMPDATKPTKFNSNPNIIANSTADVIGEGGLHFKCGVEDVLGRITRKAKNVPKDWLPKPKLTGGEMCPVGCGRLYTGKTSSYYRHKRTCTGAPP